MASMSTVKVTSNTISQCGWSASVNWTPSISPSMNRAAHSPSALLPTQVAIRCRCRHRPSPYVVNFLVPSGILVAIDVLSFYLLLESGNCAPFKKTVLLGYSIFLLMMNDLLPATSTSSHASLVRPHPSRDQKRPGVYFALCLSLMVGSPLETIFITHLLHNPAPTPPREMLSLCSHFLFPHLHFSAPASFPVSLPPPVTLEPEVSAGAQQEHEAQKQYLMELWVQFSHAMDALLFCPYLLFMASSIITVRCLWNT
uniref:5-hydroxytryptamine receptor 3D n=1 Tax=Nomascus leucogenys TaxID=61853 RepID=A0A2I3HWT8_NOMLE